MAFSVLTQQLFLGNSSNLGTCWDCESM